jgi:hypothetical protein
MSTPVRNVDEPRAEGSASEISEASHATDLRALAQSLLLDGMEGRDIAVALNIDVEALRQLVGCVECEE